MSTPEAIRLADDCEIACAAACNCMTKTPNPKFHTTHCRYRCLTRASEELRRLSALNAELVAAPQELGGLEADGMHAAESSIEAWERARALTAKAEGGAA